MDKTPEDTRINAKGMEWLKENIVGDSAKWKHEKVKALKTVADDLGVSLSGLSIAWVLKNPNVSTAILGASKTEQLEDNLKALDVVPMLTTEIMERIDAVMGNKPVAPAF